MRCHWSAFLPGDHVAAAVVAVALVAAAESGPAVVDCGCVEDGYGC